jgi:P-type Cu+ transporter
MTTDIRTTDPGDEPLEVNTNLDPICEMTVDPEEAAATGRTLDYEGRTYLFCSEGCKAHFAHEPKRYAAAGRSQP